VKIDFILLRKSHTKVKIANSSKTVKRRGFFALLRSCFYVDMQKVIEPSQKRQPVLQPPPESLPKPEPQPEPVPVQPVNPVELPNLLGAQPEPMSDAEIELEIRSFSPPKDDAQISVYSAALCIAILTVVIHLYNQTQYS
jgi:hypothetical protein